MQDRGDHALRETFAPLAKPIFCPCNILQAMKARKYRAAKKLKLRTPGGV